MEEVGAMEAARPTGLGYGNTGGLSNENLVADLDRDSGHSSGSGGGTHAGGSNSGPHAISIAEPIPPEEVWAGPLADGSVAVVLFNRATADNVTRNISVALHRLTNLPGAANASKKAGCASVHDVVRQQDLGVVCEPQTVHRMVEPRGAEMLRLTFKSDDGGHDA